MDLEVQAEAIETGRLELSSWLATHALLDVHVFLTKVRACLIVAQRVLVSAWVRQDERPEASRHRRVLRSEGVWGFCVLAQEAPSGNHGRCGARIQALL
jgi:hypothetical protein